MQRAQKGLTMLFAVGLIGLLAFAALLRGQPTPEQSYSHFVQDVADGFVAKAAISGGLLTAEYRDGRQYLVNLPDGKSSVQDLMVARGVEVVFVEASGGSGGWTVLLAILIPLGFVGLIIWLANSRGSRSDTSQVTSFGETHAELYVPGERRVTLRDVAGIPEAKEELVEIVDFLRSPERYLELGARIPKGVLLWGPPGTGKTLLARAVAGEAGVPFFSIAGSEFVEIFAGVGASRVRDLFAKARQSAPCIIFVDEIDAVGRRRSSGPGGNDEREQTINQLLSEMDGFAVNEGIIVMAATNRLDILDAAILRPGRFDRQICVDPPDRRGRQEILTLHAQDKPLADDVDVDQIAGMTVGFTGADLANLLNEAALLAARMRKAAIGMAEIREAFERIMAGGPASRHLLDVRERRRVAYHEAGHAVVAHHLTTSEPIGKVTIRPRGRALGYILYLPKDDVYYQTRSELLDRIAGLLGGRAAEEASLGELSSGAADDLQRANELARRMVTELGMSADLGPVAILVGQPTTAAIPGQKALANRTAVVVDDAVKGIIAEAYQRAVALISQHRESLDRVARALLERESLEGYELTNLLDLG